MDKETLSNYGWIVICVLVMAVMLAFASPFGNFVAGAIKSTTQGLFDTNQNALDSAGIEIMQQEFEEMLNGPSATDSPVKFGQPYQMTMDGMLMEYVFYADGSATMWMADAMGGYMPAGSVTYTETEVILEGDPIKISADGTYLYDPEDETFKMIAKYVSSAKPKTNTSYIADPNGLIGITGVSVSIGSDGSLTMYQNGATGETIPASEIQWYDTFFVFNDGEEEITCAIYPDGSKITIGEIVFVRGCKHLYEDSYICSLCEKPNNYILTAVDYKEKTGIDISAGDVVIPETFKGIDGKWYKVTGLGEAAFMSCTSLTSITIPESVTYIGEHAFSLCNSLKNIAVSTNNPNYCSEDGVLYTKDMKTIVRYPSGKENTDYTISDSVINIEKAAFSDCINLKNIVIPEGVTQIGDQAFLRSGITNVVIPNGVKNIGNGTFSGCGYLTSVTIGNGVTSIEHEAFNTCYSLTNIHIPDSVESINVYAFYTCDKLQSITVGTNNKNYCSVDGVLYSKDMKTIVIYPSGKSGTEYSIIDGVTKIEDNAFFRSTSLASIIIPDSVTSIDYHAFYNCTKLTSITIPSNITNIGREAFYYCYVMNNITFDGTKDQWNAVDFGNGWNTGVPATEVICSDGTVSLS